MAMPFVLGAVIGGVAGAIIGVSIGRSPSRSLGDLTSFVDRRFKRSDGDRPRFELLLQ
jgi:uncharacterized protein YcfJ